MWAVCLVWLEIMLELGAPFSGEKTIEHSTHPESAFPCVCYTSMRGGSYAKLVCCCMRVSCYRTLQQTVTFMIAFGFARLTACFFFLPCFMERFGDFPSLLSLTWWRISCGKTRHSLKKPGNYGKVPQKWRKLSHSEFGKRTLFIEKEEARNAELNGKLKSEFF